MTSFTRTWNAAYEAQPSDTENISLGAGRIRNLKEDIQERLEVDHFHAGNTQDGEHKKLTLGAPIATPANVANKMSVYGKDVGGKIELHALDEDGNEVQITGAGAVAAFPAGTSMLFYQSAAPAGWTKDTASTLNNHALRLVSSTAWSGGSKGATAFDSVFGSGKTVGGTALSTAQMPSHSHGIGGTGAMQTGVSNFRLSPSNSSIGNTKSTGGGNTHDHTLSLDINYINMIRCTKD